MTVRGKDGRKSEGHCGTRWTRGATFPDAKAGRRPLGLSALERLRNPHRE